MKSFIITSLIFVCNFSISVAEPAWEVTNPQPLPGQIVSIDVPSRDTIWAANDAAMLVQSTDNGVSWRIIDLPEIVSGALLIDFFSGAKGYVVAKDNPTTPFGAMVYYTSNSGSDWISWEIGDQDEPFSAKSLAAIGETVIVGGISLGISDQAVTYRLVDNRWEISFLPGEGIQALNGLSLFNQNLGWTVGDRGYLASTSDGGRSWQRIPTQLQTDLFCVHYNSPTTGWIGGGNFDSSHLYKTTNGGASWQEIEGLAASSKFVGLQSYQGAGAAVISRGGGDPDVAHLLLSTDGRNWSETGSWDHQTLSAIKTNGESIWVVGSEGLMARSTAGEEPDLVSKIITTNNLIDISFATGASGWAVGLLRTVIKSYDGGYSWELIENFPFYEPIAVVAINPWRVIISCLGSHEMLTSNGGDTWREIEISDGNVTDFEKVEESIFAISGSSISISHDDGAHWTSSEVRLNGTILSVAAVSNSVAYAAILRDSVFVTQDGGQSWSASSGVPPNTRYICFLDNNVAKAAVETQNGTSIIATIDNWQHRERIHSLGFDVTGLKYFSETDGYVVGAGGELQLLHRGTASGQPSGLRTSTAINGIELFQNWIWVCGEGGLVGRWGEDWLGIHESDEVFKPDNPRMISCWPNPTNGRINFQFSSSRETSFDLFRSDGRRVMSLSYPPAGESVSFDLSGLGSGIYFVGNHDALFDPKPIILLK